MSTGTGNLVVSKLTKEIKYDQWRRNFVFLAKFKKCSEVLFSISVPPDDMTDCDTPKAVIDRLDKLYMKKSESKQILIERQISNLKFDDEDAEKFFENFDRKINELKVAGGEVNEQRKLSFLMLCLPPSYDHLIDLLDSLPKEQRNCDYIREKILNQKIVSKTKAVVNAGTSKQEKDGEIVQALKFTKNVKDNNSACKDVIDKQTSTCYHCGKTGHIRKYCYSRNFYQSNHRGQFRGGRSKGGAGFRGQGFRGSYRGFRGNSRGGYNRGLQSSVGNDSSNYEMSVLINQVNSNAVELNSNKAEFDVNVCSKEGNLELFILWILDSGSTDHVVNDDKYFYESVELKKPCKCKVGNDQYMLMPLKSVILFVILVIAK